MRISHEALDRFSAQEPSGEPRGSVELRRPIDQVPAAVITEFDACLPRWPVRPGPGCG